MTEELSDDDSAMIEGMCLTWDHSYGLMTPEQRGSLRQAMHQIYYHNVRPVLATERTAREKAEAARDALSAQVEQITYHALALEGRAAAAEAALASIATAKGEQHDR